MASFSVKKQKTDTVHASETAGDASSDTMPSCRNSTTMQPLRMPAEKRELITIQVGVVGQSLHQVTVLKGTEVAQYS